MGAQGGAIGIPGRVPLGSHGWAPLEARGGPLGTHWPPQKTRDTGVALRDALAHPQRTQGGAHAPHMYFLNSHQPSGLGWFRVVYLFSTPFLFNPSGFNPLGRGFTPPPTPYPGAWTPSLARHRGIL